eukprot:m.100575 g.100575  ORF g.100575 m.100575 type:complete len:353 (-) comp20684_c0_seq1:27-1085(-)
MSGQRGDKVAVVDRPARRQVQKNKGPARFDAKKAAGTSYNIWYGKEEGRPQPREKSATRCVIDSDAGRTQGTADPQAWICFKFAQGKCAIGDQCRNIHCLPAGVFAKELPTGKDCFGRDRFATDREDRGGVGAFEKDPESQRTLYVGGLPARRGLEKALRMQFGEWGKLDRVHIKRDGGAGFVQYAHRASAEFAKIAMAEQSLFGDDMLNVRWADSDPNPRAAKRKRAATIAIVADSIILREDAEMAASIEEDARQAQEIQDEATEASAPRAAQVLELPSAPAGWESRRDPTSGCVYYFNPTSGVSTWVRPKPVTTSVPLSPPVAASALGGLLVGYSDSDSDSDDNDKSNVT